MEDIGVLTTSVYIRKPFYIEAIEVTADNMASVAAWCHGEVRTTDKPKDAAEENYIQVKVHNAVSERQSRAFVGDWVLYANKGFKIYTRKAFYKSFELVSSERPSVESQILERVE